MKVDVIYNILYIFNIGLNFKNGIYAQFWYWALISDPKLQQYREERLQILININKYTFYAILEFIKLYFWWFRCENLMPNSNAINKKIVSLQNNVQPHEVSVKKYRMLSVGQYKKDITAKLKRPFLKSDEINIRQCWLK